jgi:tRNA (cytidine/uridine-2'-O-)-methyltransferase
MLDIEQPASRQGRIIGRASHKRKRSMTDPRAPYEPQLHIVLYQPEIPYNTGSVGRTCVAVGAKLWLVRPLGFRLDDYYLRRAGLDYWERLVWQVVDDWATLTAQLPTHRRWLFTKKASQSYLDAAYEPGDVLVFGSESSGLPDAILEPHTDSQLRIPTRNDVRSLNLSNAVAVAAYEVQRQWRDRSFS